MNSILIVYKKNKKIEDSVGYDFFKKTAEVKFFGKISIIIPRNTRQVFNYYQDSRFFIGLSGLIHNEKKILKTKKYDDIFSLIIDNYKKDSLNLGKIFKESNGQHALFFYDKEKDTVLIFNDKFGFYGAYYYENKNLFMYSNSAEAIIKNLKYENDLNYDAISDYLSLGIVQNRETFIKSVNNLKEGSFIKKEGEKKCSIGQYFKIKFDDNSYSREKYLPLLNDKLKEVVNDLYNYSSLPKAACLTAGFDTRLMNSVLIESGIKQLAVFTRFPIRQESEINKFAIPMDEKIGREFAAKFGLEYALLGKGGENHEIEKGKFVLMNGLFGGELFGAEAYNQPASIFRVKIPSTGKTHFLTNRFKNLLTRDSIEFYYENISRIESEEWDKKVFIHKAMLLATSFFNNLEDYGGQDWQHPNKLFRESCFLKADKIFYPYLDSGFLEIMFKIPFKELDKHVFYKALLEKYYSKYLSVDILHCKKRYYKQDEETKKLYIHRRIEEEMEYFKTGNRADREKRKEREVLDFVDFLKRPLNIDNLKRGFFFHEKLFLDEKDILYHRIEEMQ